jgi:hypothetical protein
MLVQITSVNAQPRIHDAILRRGQEVSLIRKSADRVWPTIVIILAVLVTASWIGFLGYELVKLTIL